MFFVLSFYQLFFKGEKDEKIYVRIDDGFCFLYGSMWI